MPHLKAMSQGWLLAVTIMSTAWSANSSTAKADPAIR
jgi:hypothetical protein